MTTLRIDPLVTLALGMHAKKGVYALLIGSGVSRSAGIPTGWEIVNNLIDKLALLNNESTDGNPAEWFKNKYGKDASYSDLLQGLGITQSSRQNILEDYFQQNGDDRLGNKKVPQESHKAIARLVKKGYIHLILTTNFDRLIEKALEDEGVSPVVISSTDHFKNMVPVFRNRCTVVKINGDYLNPNIKNTISELEEYDIETNKRLGDMFANYGLIVCGWSAEWDKALCGLIERCLTNRDQTFWTLISNPTESAKRLIGKKDAQIIEIKDADSFFVQLDDHIIALESVNRSYPISQNIAIETLKKYLVDDKSRIDLHKMVAEETERVCKIIDDSNFPVTVVGAKWTPENFHNRLKRYEAALDILLPIMIHGCFWGETKHNSLWIETLERIANYHKSVVGIPSLKQMRVYPALLLLYGMGISSVAAKNYILFRDILSVKSIWDGYEKIPAINLAKEFVINVDFLKKSISSLANRKFPISEYLHDVLQEEFKGIIHDKEKYTNLFDRFEYLWGLTNADDNNKTSHDIVGPFVYRSKENRRGTSLKLDSVPVEIDNEVKSMDHDWPLIKAGFFSRSVARFQEVKKGYDDWWIEKSNER